MGFSKYIVPIFADDGFRGNGFIVNGYLVKLTEGLSPCELIGDAFEDELGATWGRID